MEEIHLIIKYPIQESWEYLNIVESVRYRTIEAIKDTALNLWQDVTVEEVE